MISGPGGRETNKQSSFTPDVYAIRFEYLQYLLKINENIVPQIHVKGWW